jgi:hypothetical protein
MCIAFNITMLLPPWQKRGKYVPFYVFLFCVLIITPHEVFGGENSMKISKGEVFFLSFDSALLLLFLTEEQRVHFGTAGMSNQIIRSTVCWKICYHKLRKGLTRIWDL